MGAHAALASDACVLDCPRRSPCVQSKCCAGTGASAHATAGRPASRSAENLSAVAADR